jgi:ADP-ribose pyrophosphatase
MPIVWQGKHLIVELTQYLDKNRQPREYETVRRTTHGHIAAIVAITKDRKVILVEQLRVPHAARIVEFPAGLNDKAGGENVADLAARELLEETGYAPGTPLRCLMVGPFDAGLNDDVLEYYFTSDAHKVQESSPEDTEDIRVLAVPLDEFEQFCLDNQPFCDIKMLAPIAMARHLKLI